LKVFSGRPARAPGFGKPEILSQSNILRRHLHPALAEVGFEKAGNHAFCSFRDTFIRNFTNCPESILHFWLGWGSEGMSGHYDKVNNDVAFRKDVVNRCGLASMFRLHWLQLNLMNLKSKIRLNEKSL
jgi:hypothetical protein